MTTVTITKQKLEAGVQSSVSDIRKSYPNEQAAIEAIVGNGYAGLVVPADVQGIVKNAVQNGAATDSLYGNVGEEVKDALGGYVLDLGEESLKAQKEFALTLTREIKAFVVQGYTIEQAIAKVANNGNFHVYVEKTTGLIVRTETVLSETTHIPVGKVLAGSGKMLGLYGMYETIKAPVESAYHATTGAGNTIDPIKDFAVLGAGTIVGGLVGGAIVAAELPVLLGLAVAALGGGIVSGVTKTVLDALPTVIDAAKAAGHTLEQVYQEVSDLVADKIEEAYSKTGAAAEEFLNDAETYIQGVGDGIKNLADDYGWALQNLGGLFDGIVPTASFIQQAQSSFSFATFSENSAIPESPLVLDLNGSGNVELTSVSNTGSVYFDMDNDSFLEATGWVTGGDGLLCIDLNGDGKIGDRNELFGNTATAANGFIKLDTYDTNNSNTISNADAQFGALRVWVDSNADGVSQSSELKTLSSLGITSINTTYTDVNYLIAGNSIRQESSFIMNGQTKKIVDAWLSVDRANSEYAGNYTLDPRVLFLPTIRGYGNLPDLHIAMSQDETLLNMVADVAKADLDQLSSSSFNLQSKMNAILYRWAGVDSVVDGSRGTFVDAHQLGFLEKTLDRPFNYGAGVTIPTGISAPYLSNAWKNVSSNFSGRLLAQIGAFSKDIEFDLNPIIDNTVDGLDARYFQASVTSPNVYSTLTNGHDFIFGTGTGSAESGEGNDYIANFSQVDSGAGDDQIVNAIVADGRDGNDSILNVDTAYGDAGDDVIVGRADDNNLYGSAGDDNIQGLDGSDKITGDDGNDILMGGNGNDTLGAQAFDYYYFSREYGNDILEGGDGNDALNGDEGNDTLDGGNGNDNLIGSTGNDVLRGGNGDDILGSQAVGVYYFFHEDGDDILEGGDGNDTLEADNGNDTLDGGNGNDILYGGDGNDIIIMGGGDDTIVYGDLGDDVYVYTSGLDKVYDSSGNNTIRLGQGITFEGITLFDVTTVIDVEFNVVDIDRKIVVNQGINEFTDDGALIKNLELVDGFTLDLANYSSWLNAPSTNGSKNGDVGGVVKDDTIIGLSGNNNLKGLEGNDTIHGKGGNDSVYGGNGDDAVHGGTGIDLVSGGSGDDELWGGDDADKDTLTGGSGNDIIHAGSGGVDGADASGVSLRQNVHGGSGKDTIYGDTGINDIYGDSGDDTVFGGSNIDIIMGGSGDDELHGGGGDDIIYGEEGKDKLFGDAGSDELHGGTDDNVLEGGDGDDLLYGNYNSTDSVATDDTLNGGAGNDKLFGLMGDDTYFPSGGHDYISDVYGSVIADGGTADAIKFGFGVDVDDLTFMTYTQYTSGTFGIAYDGNAYGGSNPFDSNDLVIFHNNSTDSIEIEDQYTTTPKKQIEILLFADGFALDFAAFKTSWTIGTIAGETQNGTTGDNVILGYGGDDATNAGSGNDEVHGGAGIDTIHGDAGNDLLHGGRGNDVIHGDDGMDILFGGDGNDALNGGNDSDTYVVTTGSETLTDTGGAADVIRFAEDIDAGDLIFTNIGTTDLKIAMQSGASDLTILNQRSGTTNQYVDRLDFTDGFTLNLYDYNNWYFVTSGDLTTGAANDTVIGSIDGNDLRGGSGNDTISGGAGDDILYGDDSTGAIVQGDDSLFGGDGADTIKGGGGIDTLWGGDDNDSVYGGTEDDTVHGGAGDDLTLRGDAGNDYVYGDDGNDLSVRGGDGNDHVYGGNGDDDVRGGNDNDFVYGDDGDDTVHGDAGNDTVYGGYGLDLVYGDDGIDLIYGESGDDVISGGAGVDTVYGGAGNDSIYGDDGMDILLGGDGDDTIKGGIDNDIITGGAGDDFLYGEAGVDTFVFEAPYIHSSDPVNDPINDTIYDFVMGAGGDKLDLHNVIDAFYVDPVSTAIANFISFDNSGTDSIMSVDQDGAGATYSFEQVATFKTSAATNIDLDVATLFANGQILVA